MPDQSLRARGAECTILVDEFEGIRQCRTHVLRGDPVTCADLLDGHPADGARNERAHGNARPAHDGLPAEDFRLALESFDESP